MLKSITFGHQFLTQVPCFLLLSQHLKTENPNWKKLLKFTPTKEAHAWNLEIPTQKGSFREGQILRNTLRK